ncbi:MAG: acyl-CoA dehydrogenase family protein [Longimicrobiales bacterium]|nr:acyl-CoA dehydrogenase family protein [Longimicrobiales bacterium]
MSASTEHAELLELAREFARGELGPHEAERDAARALPDALFGTLGEMGFFAMALPDSAGGLGLDPVTYHEVLSILAEFDPAVALTLAEHGAVAATLAASSGHDDAVARLAAGEALATTAILESGADETTTHLATTFDGSRLHGTKRAVVNAARAGVICVTAQIEGEIAIVCVERVSDEVRADGRRATMGLAALDFSTLVFDGAGAARVEGRDRLGDLVARRRLGVAAVAVGVARASLAHALRYAEERAQFGRSISSFDAVQAKLAEVAARSAAAEALTREVAKVIGSGPGAAARAAAAKLVATGTAMFAADEAVQIFGGYGYMRDYPVEKRMRDAKGLEVIAGTSEALRRVVTEELLESARTS